MNYVEPVPLVEVIELGGGSTPEYHPNIDIINSSKVDITKVIDQRVKDNIFKI